MISTTRKLTLTIPIEVYGQIQVAAKRSGAISMQAFIVTSATARAQELLRQYIADDVRIGKTVPGTAADNPADPMTTVGVPRSVVIKRLTGHNKRPPTEQEIEDYIRSNSGDERWRGLAIKPPE